jgi:hypothetical protein
MIQIALICANWPVIHGADEGFRSSFSIAGTHGTCIAVS